MPPPSLSEVVDQYYWWHSIDLGNGVVTPGFNPLSTMSRQFARAFDGLDLRGKDVLDVAAWNGGFSVEAKRRGARRVVALDHVTWNSSHFRGRETFDLVNEVLGLGLEAVDLDLDAPALSLGHLGQFDVVLFLGVFYHLKDPLAALREVSLAARSTLVVETFVEETRDPQPSMRFYPADELAGDPSNWWGPNLACVRALLDLAGFSRIEALEYREDPRYPRVLLQAFR